MKLCAELTNPITDPTDRRELSSVLHALELGQLTLFATYIPRIPLKYLTADLTKRPDYAQGRQRSLNHVMFYDLRIASAYVPLSTQPVAIKPYLSDRTAIKDCVTAQDINDNPDLPNTFRQIGFMRLANEDIATVTAFEQGVVSCDAIPDASKLSNDKIIFMLGVAHAIARAFHAQQYTHGDFELKNTAYDITLQPRIIDTETVRKREGNDDTELIYFIKDLERYVYSVDHTGKKDGEQTVEPEMIIEHFLEPYRKDISDIYTTKCQDQVRHAIDDMKTDIMHDAA